MNKIRFIPLLVTGLLSRYSNKIFKDKQIKQNSNFGSSNIFRTSSRSMFDRKVLFIIPLVVIAFLYLKNNSREILTPTFSEGFIGLYTQDNLPSNVTKLISGSLVTLDKTSNPKPDLASGWQVNNDATIYVFTIRDNLYWDDGTPIKSSSIKFNFQNIEVTYPNDKTIQFKLKEAYSAFPALLSSPIFKDNTLVGIGAYKVTKIIYNKNLISGLSLSPRSQEKNLPKIRVHFYPDEKTARTAFLLGEIDSFFGINDTAGLTNQKGIDIKNITNYNRFVAVFYNVKDPILSDKNLRKALSYGIKPVLNEEIAKSPISPESWAFNDSVKSTLDDSILAKNYLTKVEKKDSQITLITTSSLINIGEQIVKNWKDMGISAVLRVESGVPQNFQALLFTQNIPSDPDQYTLWHSTQTSTNITKYSSPRADQDLEDGRKIAEQKKRLEKYLDFQKVLLEDSPSTFLYFPKFKIVYRKNIESHLNNVLNLQLGAS